MPGREKRERTQLQKDVMVTFGSDAGERVLRWLMKRCHIDQTSTTTKYDPYEAMFRDGERSVLIDILSLMQNPWEPKELLAQLEKEREDYFQDEATN